MTFRRADQHKCAHAELEKMLSSDKTLTDEKTHTKAYKPKKKHNNNNNNRTNETDLWLCDSELNIIINLQEIMKCIYLLK